jgi:hypothetical protein
MVDLNELMKGTFLEELSEIKIVEPNSEWDEEEDQVLGVMNELEKRVYSLGNQYGRAAALVKTQVQFDPMDGDSKTQLAEQHILLKETAHNIRELLWSLLKWRMQTEDKHCLGIRTGFKVIQCKNDHSKGMPQSLQNLLGGLMRGPGDD